MAKGKLTIDKFNQLFVECLRAFTHQNPEMILCHRGLFVVQNNQFQIDYTHPSFQALPQVNSYHFNLLQIIAECFLELYRDPLFHEQSGHASALTQQANKRIRKDLEVILYDFNTDIISAIAREKYESSDNEGFYAAFIIEEDEDVTNVLANSFVRFSDVDCAALDYDTVHGHRKLLNLSTQRDSRHCLIYQRDERVPGSYQLLGTAARDEALAILPGVHFMSHAAWGLSLPAVAPGTSSPRAVRPQCCAVFRDGHYCLPEINFRVGEESLLHSKLDQHQVEFPGTNLVQNAYNILQAAKRQPNGALVILAGKETMERLCDRLCPNHNAIDLRKNTRLVNLCTNDGAMDRFASIDGAVMADFSGEVYAIGCILDGTTAPGSIARGSRYNGARGFLYREGHRRGRPFLLAIIVSQDGIVDIITSDEIRFGGLKSSQRNLSAAV